MTAAIIILAALLAGTVIVGLRLRGELAGLEADYGDLVTDHLNLLAKYRKLTDRDERGRFKK